MISINGRKIVGGYIADGSATAPGLAFASDPDSGLYRLAANRIGMIANGVAATIEPSFFAVSAGPGYGGFVSLEDVDDTPTTIIPDGTWDVTSGLTAIYRLSESGGGVDGNVVMVANGGNVNIYDDGVDIFNLAVAADGSVTVVRSQGAATADIAIWLAWI